MKARVEVEREDEEVEPTVQEGWLFALPASISPVYDEDGNLVEDARWLYTWDGENRLARMEEKGFGVAAGLDPATAPKRLRLDFGYDAQHRRIAKVVRRWESQTNSFSRVVKSRRYVYDGWNMIAELDHTTATGTGLEGSTVVRTQVWGLDLSGTPQGAGGVGGLLAVRHDGQSYAPLLDGNGNVMGLVGLGGAKEGQVVARYDYDPSGNQITNTAPELGEDVNPFGFSTKFTDEETGLVYYGFRYYSSEMGRWLSRDPIEESGGVNLYGMVENDAVNLTDLLGQSICVTTRGGKFLFELDDSQQSRRMMTAQELYDNVKAQWFEPNANNYMPLIAMAKNIHTFPELRHYSWDDIAKFSLVDRYSFMYQNDLSGDWKKSVARGFLLVTVGRMPYWADAIGQIPFAVDTYRMHRIAPNVTSHDKAILATLETGRKHHDGSLLPTSALPMKGHYDEFMVARGAIWASNRFRVVSEGKGISWHKRLEETNWAPNNLALPITSEQVAKFNLK